MCFKKARGYKLRNDRGELNDDPADLGQPVYFLPPCLDPDCTGSQKQDPTLMEQRYVHGKFELAYLENEEKDLRATDVLSDYPVFLHFYPD